MGWKYAVCDKLFIKVANTISSTLIRPPFSFRSNLSDRLILSLSSYKDAFVGPLTDVVKSMSVRARIKYAAYLWRAKLIDIKQLRFLTDKATRQEFQLWFRDHTADVDSAARAVYVSLFGFSDLVDDTSNRLATAAKNTGSGPSYFGQLLFALYGRNEDWNRVFNELTRVDTDESKKLRTVLATNLQLEKIETLNELPRD
jgi:hypothetical protein